MDESDLCPPSLPDGLQFGPTSEAAEPGTHPVSPLNSAEDQRYSWGYDRDTDDPASD